MYCLHGSIISPTELALGETKYLSDDPIEFIHNDTHTPYKAALYCYNDQGFVWYSALLVCISGAVDSIVSVEPEQTLGEP